MAAPNVAGIVKTGDSTVNVSQIPTPQDSLGAICIRIGASVLSQAACLRSSPADISACLMRSLRSFSS